MSCHLTCSLSDKSLNAIYLSDTRVLNAVNSVWETDMLWECLLLKIVFNIVNWDGLQASMFSLFESSDSICILEQKNINIPFPSFSNLLVHASFSWWLIAFALISALHSLHIPELPTRDAVVIHRNMWFWTHQKTEGKGRSIKAKQKPNNEQNITNNWYSVRREKYCLIQNMHNLSKICFELI